MHILSLSTHISTVKRPQNDNDCKEKLVTVTIWVAVLGMGQDVLCVSAVYIQY